MINRSSAEESPFLTEAERRGFFYSRIPVIAYQLFIITIDMTMFNESDYIKFFEEYNDPGISYLKMHAHRFLLTKELVSSGLARTGETRVLDIASHWLHNALLYAIDGYKVTACDVAAGRISSQAVIKLAHDYDISLIPCQSLQNPFELDSLPENMFDIVMFTEVIEHMTFNPGRLWKKIYRVMKEGGKIIVTTPNYHCVRGSLGNDFKKLLQGYSTGIAVSDLVEMLDYSPHWKEYTKKDIVTYFCKLSTDFNISKILYNDLYGWHIVGRVEKLLRRLLPGLLNPTMYVEVDLPKKKAGVQAICAREYCHHSRLTVEYVSGVWEEPGSKWLWLSDVAELLVTPQDDGEAAFELILPEEGINETILPIVIKIFFDGLQCTEFYFDKCEKKEITVPVQSGKKMLMKILSDKHFIPDDIIHNSDTRKLSIILNLPTFEQPR